MEVHLEVVDQLLLLAPQHLARVRDEPLGQLGPVVGRVGITAEHDNLARVAVLAERLEAVDRTRAAADDDGRLVGALAGIAGARDRLGRAQRRPADLGFDLGERRRDKDLAVLFLGRVAVQRVEAAGGGRWVRSEFGVASEIDLRPILDIANLDVEACAVPRADDAAGLYRASEFKGRRRCVAQVDSRYPAHPLQDRESQCARSSPDPRLRSDSLARGAP